jgi:hypothetical protein
LLIASSSTFPAKNNIMNEKLEIIAFGAIPFVIDREKQEFKQYNKPENIIRFDNLKKAEGYYTVKFDKHSNYLSTNWQKLDTSKDNASDIFIPALIIDSPESLTDAFKQDLNTSSHYEEWGFYLGNKDTALRLSGVLPHIDLAGTDFTIDWRLKQLRETELPWKNISLEVMEMSDNGREYLCFFNKETHELFEPDERLFELPGNVVVLEIPYEIKLDPVAVARSYGMGETYLLPENPVQMQLVAKVTPLIETGLAEFIKENIKRRDDLLHGIEKEFKRGRG